MLRHQLTSRPSMPQPQTGDEGDLNAPSANIVDVHLTTTASLFSSSSFFATTTNTVPSSGNADSTLTCPYCDRNITSRIGLAGHLQL
nr:unnamed protein product [Spirometra erinaceieuropaei]